MREPESLTVTTYRDELASGIVVRLHDNMTPGRETRYAKYVLADSEMDQAATPAIMWYACMQLLVQEFNKMPGKKVKLVHTFDYAFNKYVAKVVPLPYSMGLIYYSDLGEEPCPEA